MNPVGPCAGRFYKVRAYVSVNETFFGDEPYGREA